MCFLQTSILLSQTKNLAQRLGYEKDAKLLIVHADDIGMAHSVNSATMQAFEKSGINSASIMVPCPWFPEIAAYARENSAMDLGLHLTLTSEWKYYKWGPVTSKDSVPGLVNEDGYLYPLVPDFIANAKAEEVEIELRNQIKKAYRFGIDVTHLDAHMGAAVSTPEYAAVYMKVGKEFQLPVLLDKRVYTMADPHIKSLLDDKTVVVDRLYIAEPPDFEKGMKQYYSGVLQNLSPGLNGILIHLAYDDQEMQAVTVDHPDYGAAWRQADFDFFTSAECAQLLTDNDIILVTWRELRDKIVRSE